MVAEGEEEGKEKRSIGTSVSCLMWTTDRMLSGLLRLIPNEVSPLFCRFLLLWHAFLSVPY